MYYSELYEDAPDYEGIFRSFLYKKYDVIPGSGIPADHDGIKVLSDSDVLDYARAVIHTYIDDFVEIHVSVDWDNEEGLKKNKQHDRIIIAADTEIIDRFIYEVVMGDYLGRTDTVRIWAHVIKDFYECMSEEGVIGSEQEEEIHSFIDDKVENEWL